MSDAGNEITTEPVGEGILTLCVQGATLVRDTDLIGSMSPYCTLVY